MNHRPVNYFLPDKTHKTADSVFLYIIQINKRGIDYIFKFKREIRFFKG